MDFLRANQWEKSRLSQCEDLLFKLTPGTAEYDLVRKIDLSFGNLDLSGLQCRSYWRLLQANQAQERYDQRHGADYHIRSLYLDSVAQLYYNLATSYLSHCRNLDRNFTYNTDDYNWLLFDFYQMQSTGILSLNYNLDQSTIINSLSTSSNRNFYESRAGFVRDVIGNLQFSGQERGDMFISQLSSLGEFYDSVCGLIDIYAHQRQTQFATYQPTNQPAGDLATPGDQLQG